MGSASWTEAVAAAAARTSTRVPAAETSNAISRDACAHAPAGWAQPLRGPGQQQLEHATAAKGIELAEASGNNREEARWRLRVTGAGHDPRRQQAGAGFRVTVAATGRWGSATRAA